MLKNLLKNTLFKYKIFENTKSIYALYLLKIIALLIPKKQDNNSQTN